MSQQWCTKGWLFSLTRRLMDIWRLLLLSWPYEREDGEKLKHQTLRLDQLTYTLNKAPVLQVNCGLYDHVTWGRPRILFEKRYLDYLQGRKLIAYSGQRSWQTPKIQQLLSLLPPALLLSKLQKTLAVSGRVQSLISHSQNVQALNWYSFSIAGSLQ